MESLAFVSSVLFKNLLSWKEYLLNVSCAVCLFLVVISIYAIFAIYPKIRKKYPLIVNCWFCCQDTKVSYELQNKWNCPSCGQYNGFDKNGDYNKVINEHFNSNLNEFASNNLKSTNTKSKNSYEDSSNGFCKLCNINQQLKIQQLALFVPMNENNYDQEVEEYSKKLEAAYKLCPACEKILKTTLEKQEYLLFQNQLNSIKQNVSTGNQLNISTGCKNKKINNFKWGFNKFLDVLNIVILIYSAFLMTALIIKWKKETQSLHLIVPYFSFLHGYETNLMVFFNLIKGVNDFSIEVSLALLLFQLMFKKNRRKQLEQMNLFFWGLLHVSLWSNFTGLQIVLCGVSIFFTYQSIQNKKIYLIRKPLKKEFTFKPRSKGTMDEAGETLLRKEKLSPAKEKISYSSVKKFHARKFENLGADAYGDWPAARAGKRKNENAENECELSLNEEPVPANHTDKSQTNNYHSSNNSAGTHLSLPREPERLEREFSPGLNDVYNNLSNLTIGQRKNGTESRRKPMNFLFENFNFSDRKTSSTSSSSIIKPSKLIKNLSSSWIGQEPIESVSRSSTPSSNYSNQKPDNHFGNPFTRRDYLECYEGNNRFYNLNCCPYEFSPYQQYAGPMGQGAVYMYTRPLAPGLFPFPASPPSPPFVIPSPKFTASGYYPSFYDANNSESDSIFQNASKSFENDKKWFRIKTVSYYLSIFMNVVTLLGLTCLFSTGIVSVDWNFPKFNFFT